MIGIILGWRVIEDDRPDKVAERFDYTGALLFTAGLVSLLVALDQGHAWGWASAPTLSLLGAAIVILIVFIMVERRHKAPMLDLSLFGSRVFSAAASSARLNARNVGMVLGIGLSGAVFTTVLAHGDTFVHAVQPSLYVAVVMAVLGAIAAFVR